MTVHASSLLASESLSSRVPAGKHKGKTTAKEERPLEIERRSGLSLEEYVDRYDAKWPVLLTDAMDQ